MKVLFSNFWPFLVFWPGYYTNIRVSPFITLDQAISTTKIIPIKTTQDIIPNKIIKKSSQESVNNFLKIFDKIFKLQKRQINKTKQKLIKGKQSSRMTIISSLDNSNKKI